MTDTTTPAELVIPESAVATLHICDADSHLHDRAETCVAAISRPVVAAELRRLADRLERRFIGGPIDGESAAYMLRARADELDGGKP